MGGRKCGEKECKKREKKEEVEVKEGRGIAFWNVARLENKDRDFWRDLKRWNAMGW